MFILSPLQFKIVSAAMTKSLNIKILHSAVIVKTRMNAAKQIATLHYKNSTLIQTFIYLYQGLLRCQLNVVTFEDIFPLASFVPPETVPPVAKFSSSFHVPPVYVPPV